MKKAISILLAILMVFTLFACAAKQEEVSPEPSDSAPVSADNTQDSAEPSEMIDVTKTANELGFFYDGVDPQSRDTYDIVFGYPFTLLLNKLMAEAMRNFSDELNITITEMTSENDMDMFVLNLETYIGQGDVDGFVVVIDAAATERINEVLYESGVPYIGWLNSVVDETGSELIPCIGLDDVTAGAITLQWLYDNHETYWGEIDTSKLGLMNMTTTVNIDLNERAIGSEAKFKELLPNNDQIFLLDGTTELTQDKAYDMASATFAANPDVAYWFVTSCLEMYSQGVARAAESLKMEDRVLITDVGSDILCSEWETGYAGSWVSCLAISNYLYAAPTICGLVALIDGKATHESLWADQRAPGDLCTFYNTGNEMITKDTYREYFNNYAELADAPLPYPGA